jgi:hypothetical protein
LYGVFKISTARFAREIAEKRLDPGSTPAPELLRLRPSLKALQIEPFFMENSG